MDKKYKLRTDLSYTFDGHKLYRVEALKDFGNVKKGSVGGFIEKEDNLSQEGNCWIFLDAKVYGNAKVFGNAIINGFAQVCDNSVVFDNAQVRGYSKVKNNARVFNNARMEDCSIVKDNAQVYGNSLLLDNAQVCDNAHLIGTCLVRDNAIVCGDACIYDVVRFISDAKIMSPADYYIGHENWECGHNFVYTRSNNQWSTFFINGTKEEILEFAKKRGEINYNFYKNVIEFVEKMYS
jgi:bacterial transferase hexapeptide repeat protein